MGLLPISGFVLAGGRSSRMGADKATMMFRGRSLVELAVAKLATVCADVAIVGNRNDLEHVAPVVREARLDVGPGAGIEAGLMSARCDWCLFVPVDVPLLPAELLRRWAEDVLAAEGDVRVSYLITNGRRQPSICLVHRSCLGAITKALDEGERKLAFLLSEARVMDAAAYASAPEDLERWFLNLNTPEEFAEAERVWVPDEGRGTRD